MKTFNFYEPGELQFKHHEWYIGMFNTTSFGMDLSVPSKFTVEFSWNMYDRAESYTGMSVCYSEDKTKEEYGNLGDTGRFKWIHKDDLANGCYYKLEAKILDHYDDELMYFMPIDEFNNE